MFLRRVKTKNKTYYYLTQRVKGEDRLENLAVIGALDKPSPYHEEQLVSKWALALLSGTERAWQKNIEREKELIASRDSALGRGFDLEKCLEEFRAVYEKYGEITKTLLEKTARPRGEISWGTTTILKNLRRRGLTLGQVFHQIRVSAAQSTSQSRSAVLPLQNARNP